MDAHVIGKGHEEFHVRCIIFPYQSGISLLVDDLINSVRRAVAAVDITRYDIRFRNQLPLFVVPEVLVGIINFYVSITDVIQTAFYGTLFINRFPAHGSAAL